MSSTYFENERFYIQSATSLEMKISRVEAIICALEDQALAGAANADITEYSLDDGQTKIRTVYRNPESIMRSINVYEQYLERLYGKLNGRGYRLVDGHDNRLT